MGVEIMIRVLIELEMKEYPTDTEVEVALQKQLTSSGLMWRVDDD